MCSEYFLLTRVQGVRLKIHKQFLLFSVNILASCNATPVVMLLFNQPENILLTAEGDVRICDLGIASLVRSSSCHPQRVGVDALPMSLVIGSPPWSPPEASAGHLAPADDGDTLSPLHTQEENEDAGVDRFSPANAASHNHHTTGISVFDSAWDVFSLAMLTW